MTYAYLTYPASGIEAATKSILFSVIEYIKGVFPPKTFRQVFVDDNETMKSIYKNAMNVYAGKQATTSSGQEIVKSARPSLMCGYSFDSSFDSNDTGLGETQPYMYGDVFFTKRDLQEVFPIFIDKDREITIGTRNLRIKVTAEALINAQSKEEQFTIYNYVINSLKIYYMKVLEGITASFILPNFMVDKVKDMLYGNEASYDDIGEDFDKYLINGSKGGIKPVYRNNKKEDKFYELQYIYNRVDFKISGKPQMDAGTKENDAYDNYTVRFPFTVEFYVPTNYIIKTPELVPGMTQGVFQVEDNIAMDEVSDKNLHAQMKHVHKGFSNTMKRIPTYANNYDEASNRAKPNSKYGALTMRDDSQFYFLGRDEFCLASAEDYYNLTWLLEKLENQDYYTAWKKLSQTDRREIFRWHIFEGDYVLDRDKYYTLDENSDEDYILKIHEGDTKKVYSIELYCDTEKLIDTLDHMR